LHRTCLPSLFLPISFLFDLYTPFFPPPFLSNINVPPFFPLPEPPRYLKPPLSKETAKLSSFLIDLSCLFPRNEAPSFPPDPIGDLDPRAGIETPWSPFFLPPPSHEVHQFPPRPMTTIRECSLLSAMRFFRLFVLNLLPFSLVLFFSFSDFVYKTAETISQGYENSFSLLIFFFFFFFFFCSRLCMTLSGERDFSPTKDAF